MKTSIKHWRLSKLLNLEERINPKSQFQRGEVWGDSRKQLLIDSILRGYDVPKLYLSETKSKTVHDYDVTDGQQRLRAFWGFFKDEYPLGEQSHAIDGKCLTKLHFSELPPEVQNRLRNFKATVVIVTNATTEELRTLFARLQMGIVLNPAELRNAIASAVGNVIHTAAETHRFFLESKIPTKRYKRQDLLTHALALAHYNNSLDLKAPTLRKFYEDCVRTYDKDMVRKAYDVLDHLEAINRCAQQRIFNKWGFVDLFWLLFQKHQVLNKIDVQAFANAFVDFENQRIRYNKNPKDLLSLPGKKHMYDYILAFNFAGATRHNIAARNHVMNKVFTSMVGS